MNETLEQRRGAKIKAREIYPVDSGPDSTTQAKLTLYPEIQAE
jgi:hypothetical protein